MAQIVQCPWGHAKFLYKNWGHTSKNLRTHDINILLPSSNNNAAVGSLWVRASDSRPGFDARCHQIPSEYTRSTCSLNQWVRKSCGLNHECRGLENISLQSHGKIVEVEIGRDAIYRPFGEFRRANSYCYLYGAQGLGQRQAYF
ncbi:hypothetical protein TNCV_2295781 [Trichonephila clavipes]|nr:hypothetical protein TNCV_2295781 [Trichonephila clavipes]